jgi:hypothetical protein
MLPIEIRDRYDGALVGRTVLRTLQDKLAQVGPGEWLITFLLPSGNTLNRAAKTDTEGRLDWAPPITDLQEIMDIADFEVTPALTTIYFAQKERSGSDILNRIWSGVEEIKEHLFSWQKIASNEYSKLGSFRNSRSARLRFRFYHCPLLSDDDFRKIRPLDVLINKREKSTEISDAHDRALLVQVFRFTTPPLNLALPPGSTLVLCSEADDQMPPCLRLSIRFNDDLADLINELTTRGRLAELEILAREFGEAELRELKTKPVGAALSLLHFLLRTRETEFVEAALSSLSDVATLTPDVYAMKAELLARSGQHEAALAGFLQAANAGLPIFANSLTYIIDRLHLYEKVAHVTARKGRQAGGILPRNKEIGHALERVVPFGAHCIWSAPVILAYPGVHPSKPGVAAFSIIETVQLKLSELLQQFKFTLLHPDLHKLLKPLRYSLPTWVHPLKHIPQHTPRLGIRRFEPDPEVLDVLAQLDYFDDELFGESSNRLLVRPRLVGRIRRVAERATSRRMIRHIDDEVFRESQIDIADLKTQLVERALAA